jgi:PKD repeat protein
VILYGKMPIYTFHEAGFYEVNLTVSDAAGNDNLDHMVVEVKDITIPDVEAGIDLIVDQHEIFRLNGSLCSDNVGISNWTWTIEMGDEVAIMYEMVTEYTLHEAGIYQVTLNASDSAGNSEIDTLEITVRDITPPVVITQGDITIDQFTTLYLNSTGSTDNIEITNCTWTISMDDDEKVLYGPAPSIFIDRAGIFHAVINMCDQSFNTANASFNITVIDREKPIIHTETKLTIDQHQDLILNATSSSDNVGIDNFTWKLQLDEDIITLYGAYAAMTIDEAGSYSAYLNVSDAIGNWAGVTVDVSVRDITPPTPKVNEEFFVDAGNETTFNASESEDNMGIDQYQWSFEYDGEEIILEGEIVNFTFDIPGTYNVTLTISDLEGNEESEIFTVTVVDPDGDDDDDSPEEEKDDEIPWLLIAGIIAGIILTLLLIMGFLIFLRKKDEDPEDWEE